MASHPDCIVLGLGAMGSAAAYRLASRGRAVLGFDRFRPPHAHGSSHGETRIIREAYFEHPAYVPMVQRAYALWSELEQRSRSLLYQPTGGVMIGAAESELVIGALRSAREHGLAHQCIGAAEVRERFPALQPADDMVGVVEERAGILFPERCIAAHLKLACEARADLRFDEPVLNWEADGGGVRVSTHHGEYRASYLIATAGAWLSDLVPELAPILAIERQTLYWFEAPTSTDLFNPTRCPVHLWQFDGRQFFYGFPDLGEGVKVARHHHGRMVPVDAVDREVSAEEVADIRGLVRRFMPHADGPLRKSTVCLYTNTPDEHFWIDRHPEHAQVLIVSACSGHGFKFASVIGEIVADLIGHGQSRFDLSLFRRRVFYLAHGGEAAAAPPEAQAHAHRDLIWPVRYSARPSGMPLATKPLVATRQQARVVVNRSCVSADASSCFARRIRGRHDAGCVAKRCRRLHSRDLSVGYTAQLDNDVARLVASRFVHCESLHRLSTPWPGSCAMSRITCRFCAHANPQRARFCNECGSQIDLRPCRRCDAVNSASASACHECGAVLADEAEHLLVAADSGATSHGVTAVNVQHAPVAKSFAPSIHASPTPVCAVVHSPKADSVGSIVGHANSDLPAVALPVHFADLYCDVVLVDPMVEAATADRSPARDFDAHVRRRSAQGAALLALTFAIAGGAYWAHRPSTAPEDRSVQQGVIASAQPAVPTPTEPSVASVVVQSQSALAVSSPTVDDEPFEPNAAQVTTEEPKALRIAAEPTSQRADAPDAPSAQSRAVRRSVPSTAAIGPRKTLASRAYDAPQLPWPAAASSHGEPACTQAVAALGLCTSPGSR